jgi:uncharacterized protein (TIGR02246 family)
MIRSFLLFAIIALAISSTAAQVNSKDESSLKGLVKQLTTAQLAYDAPALDKIFTADYIEISPLGEFDPRDKVLGFYAPEEKAKTGNISGSVDAVEYSIRTYDKFAVVITRLNFTMTADGKTMPPRSIRATFVCRKEKEGWKIASAHYAGIRPAAPPKTQ